MVSDNRLAVPSSPPSCHPRNSAEMQSFRAITSSETDNATDSKGMNSGSGRRPAGCVGSPRRPGVRGGTRGGAATDAGAGAVSGSSPPRRELGRGKDDKGEVCAVYGA